MKKLIFPKICKYCGEEKKKEEWAFQKHTYRDELSSFGRCKDCVGKRKKSPKIKEINRKSMLKTVYGITPEEYNKILERQNFCCAVCKKHLAEFKKALSVDHNHETGKIRGLLCQKCNLALGLLEDNLESIRELLRYLEKE